jgi:hypothetical protein
MLQVHFVTNCKWVQMEVVLLPQEALNCNAKLIVFNCLELDLVS